MNEHIKSMHGTETFQCDDCTYIGKTKRMLKVHIGIKHGEKKFSCKFCDYKGGYQHRINRHMKKAHALKETLQCKTCAFITNDNHNLKEHNVKKHNKFCCDKCNKIFINGTNLR